MEFAPDGRLFVAEQGGQLRVIKNGVLLATPFRHPHRQFVGRARPARRRVRPQLRHRTTSSTSTTRPRLRPIHNRVSRFTANGDVAVAGSETIVILDLNPRAAPPTTTAAPSTSARTASSTSPSATTRTAANAQSLDQPARQDPAHQRRRHDPDRQPVLQPGHGRQPRDLGARPAQPVHLRVPARHRPHVHQRRRPEHVGGDQRRPGRLELRLAQHRGADRQRELPLSGLRLSARRGTPTGCAITGGAFYDPRVLQFPASYDGDYFFADFCGGWIYKLETRTSPRPSSPPASRRRST